MGLRRVDVGVVRKECCGNGRGWYEACGEVLRS